MIDPLGLYIPRSAGSVSGSVSGLAMSPSISSLLVSLCSGTGSFANLIIAAEKLAQEHDSPKIDHYWADELKSLPEYIRKMVEKFPETFNESAKFRLLHKKDETRLWKRVESELSATKSLCDQLSETFQHLAGQIQDADKDEGILVKELFDSFTDLAIVNDGLKDILRLVSLEMTLHDRLKICTVIVVKTLDDLERNSSDSLRVMLFHLRSYESYNKALGKFIELSDQYHYQHGEDTVKFIVVRMRDFADEFKVTAYPTVVVRQGDKEVGRVSIVDTGLVI